MIGEGRAEAHRATKLKTVTWDLLLCPVKNTDVHIYTAQQKQRALLLILLRAHFM